MKNLHITNREFKQRRKQLMQSMGANSIAILPAAPMRIRNRDAEYPYRQDSDFHYLTGFPEPQSVAVLKPGRSHGEFILFCREKNPEQERWVGYFAGQEGACAEYGADDAFPIDDIDDILPGLIEGCDRLYYSMGVNPEFDRQVMGWVNSIRSKLRTGAHMPNEVLVLDHLLHDMRLYKSNKEIQLMREAGRVSALAHRSAMQICRPGMMEYQLEAVYLNHFMQHGCRSPAYSSIVGGGANACVLHYIENNQPLVDGDLVLVDAGAEYQNYAGDITRTFPVNGRFSEAQKQVYQIVLDAQLAAINAVKPGNHWDDPHAAAVRVLTQGLVRLGILKGRIDKLIKEGAYRPYYMHRTGHWLGLDVHDVGDYKVGDEWRVLEPGMVLTVEPGLYFAPELTEVPEAYRGIGIRIEDDVLVTESGCEILTDDVPKQIAEIEELMAG